MAALAGTAAAAAAARRSTPTSAAARPEGASVSSSRRVRPAAVPARRQAATAAAVPNQAEQARQTRQAKQSSVQEDLKAFVSYARGSYTNKRQVEAEKSVGFPFPHEFVACDLVPLPTSHFPPRHFDSWHDTHVAFSHFYYDCDKAKTFRARLYAVDVHTKESVHEGDGDEGGEGDQAERIRLRVFYVKNDGVFSTPTFDARSYQDWGSHELEYTNCQLYWTRARRKSIEFEWDWGWEVDAQEEDTFLGESDAEGFTVISRRTGRPIRIEDQLVVTPSELWLNDRGYDEDGNIVYGNPAGVPYKMEREWL